MARILVTGAMGTVGSAVLRHLLAEGHKPVAAVRDPEAVDLPGGAERVHFDFQDVATHAPALEGTDGLFLMRPPAIHNVERDLHPVLDAAKAAGVRRVAFLSVLGAEKNPLLPHRKTEKRLEADGFAYTHLRASNFMQNFADVHAADVRERDEVYVPAGRGRIGYVDARDIGAVAAAVLAEGGHACRAYALTGPAAIDHYQVAAALSDALGRRIVYPKPGVIPFALHRLRQGDAPPYVLVMAYLYTTARLGLADDVTDAVERVLGRPATGIRTFAADHREAWQ